MANIKRHKEFTKKNIGGCSVQRLHNISIKPTSFADKTQGLFEYVSIQVIRKVLITI